MTLQEYNKIIERFDKAFAADKWFQIDHFKVLYDELKEKRDILLKANTEPFKVEIIDGPLSDHWVVSKDAPQGSITLPDAKETDETTPSTDDMVKDAREAVAAFDAGL